jgi:hypothetical protein
MLFQKFSHVNGLFKNILLACRGQNKSVENNCFNNHGQKGLGLPPLPTKTSRLIAGTGTPA